MLQLIIAIQSGSGFATAGGVGGIYEEGDAGVSGVLTQDIQPIALQEDEPVTHTHDGFDSLLQGAWIPS